MTSKKSLNKTVLSIVIVIVIAVVIVLFWFFYRGMRQEQRSLEVEKMSVQLELERVIDGWCDAEAASYTSQTKLQGLWRRKFPTTPAYNPQGITKLIAGIEDNQLFKNCSAAQNIGPGFFLPGGAIQTVGDLNAFLTPCENT